MVDDSGGSGASVADEVWEADTVITVAEQREMADGFNALGELGHAVQMADFILWEASRPAADGGEFGGGVGQRAEDFAELCERGGGDFGVGG